MTIQRTNHTVTDARGVWWTALARRSTWFFLFALWGIRILLESFHSGKTSAASCMNTHTYLDYLACYTLAWIAQAALTFPQLDWWFEINYAFVFLYIPWISPVICGYPSSSSFLQPFRFWHSDLSKQGSIHLVEWSD